MASTSDLLADAKTAYHSLLTGKQAVEFRDSNGETVRYNVANISKLAAYIADLERQLSTTPCTSGPMRVWF